jgi:hypothetical protein
VEGEAGSAEGTAGFVDWGMASRQPLYRCAAESPRRQDLKK